VKAEAANYLAKAREDLSDAPDRRDRFGESRGAFGLLRRLSRGRGFHCREDRVEKTGKVARSHSGVCSEFARLVRDDPHIGKTATAFLAQAHKIQGDRRLRCRRGCGHHAV